MRVSVRAHRIFAETKNFAKKNRALGRLSFIHRICVVTDSLCIAHPSHIRRGRALALAVFKCNKSKNKKRKKLKNLCEKGQFIDKNRSTESGTKIKIGKT